MTPRNTRHRPAKPSANGQVELKQLLMTMGRTGLKNLGGRVQEEYLQALKSWSIQSKIFIEMGDDSMVGTLLTAIKLPLLRADFDVTVASEGTADREARDFLWANMTHMKRQTWRSHVKDQLDALQFGFAIGEVVLGGRPDGRFWIENIDPRGQETLYRWGFDEHDTATHFVQRDPDTGRELHIPLNKCVHYAFDGRKGNPQGKSLLRSLFRDWRFMRDFQDMEAIGVERDVGGMPVLKLPDEFLETADLTDIKDALAGTRMDETMFFLLPSSAELTAYGGGSKMYDIDKIIQRLRVTILMRFFAQFLLLGTDKVGTQALVQGQEDFFQLALGAIQQDLLEIWQQQLVPLLFRFNRFPGMTGLPQITWQAPGKQDIQALMEAYTKGVGADVITPIRDDEEFVRALLGLPDLPEGVGDEPRGPGAGVEQPAFDGAMGDWGVNH